MSPTEAKRLRERTRKSEEKNESLKARKNESGRSRFRCPILNFCSELVRTIRNFGREMTCGSRRVPRSEKVISINLINGCGFIQNASMLKKIYFHVAWA
jgi:hypothetical protein